MAIQAILRILPFRVSNYAINIYIFGNTTLTAIPAEYYTPVEMFAAANYTLARIDNALAQGWVTQQQHDETISYMA